MDVRGWLAEGEAGRRAKKRSRNDDKGETAEEATQGRLEEEGRDEPATPLDTREAGRT